MTNPFLEVLAVFNFKNFLEPVLLLNLKTFLL